MYKCSLRIREHAFISMPFLKDAAYEAHHSLQKESVKSMSKIWSMVLFLSIRNWKSDARVRDCTEVKFLTEGPSKS